VTFLKGEKFVVFDLKQNFVTFVLKCKKYIEMARTFIEKSLGQSLLAEK
jgi:hypothetical protein